MNSQDFESLVVELTDLPAETEWVEFKENNCNPDDIGEYISALANSAALMGKSRGYIVWGIQNVSQEIVGTHFDPRSFKVGGEDLEAWVSRLLAPRPDFRFHDGYANGKRIVLLEIPAAAHTPIRFKSDEFVRVGSYKKKLREHPEKERVLWSLFARTPFEQGIAVESVRPEDVARLIDYERYFKMADRVVPEEREVILDKLIEERFVIPAGKGKVQHHKPRSSSVW